MSGRVLIVDDEAHLRQMMRMTLEVAGYTVGEAENGPAGLEAFGDGSGWDAVLLDQRMPGMDGLETLEKIRERDASARAIMVTAYASIELAVDAMKSGALDFVRKPMTPETLRNAVEAALARPTGGRAPASRGVTRAHSPIETVTLNGFRIGRVDEESSVRPDRKVFRVRRGPGDEANAFVDISSEAVDRVRRIARRELPASSTFWTVMAERVLATYLWNEGRAPQAPLVVAELTRDDLLAAERWAADR